ncbi:3-hydroxyacyl-ACP dehydratase FabZ [Parvularcula lutaonensis]|uniref:3-hydroxyacyl-[acyl-carrier-protein] dehydratase FabZ n=1 Tax=Parvularcula lutaonensis TaxID=491923 RepID=A0ABV7MED4_9PROT|nr:3-hydroxyacyl-ACP dehydratase FabZ [Parvularcula lutaonensis]GGY54444.1 3-hydroxyacyl-[acyl-carrier-protein] dehydratase FabZ [Parvularcula lutaonensis]
MTDTDERLPDLDLKGIKDILPHRYPFLMIDKIVDITKTGGAVGVKMVTINEQFFQGHFPEMPVMPGVLIIEAMAQAAAAYTAYADNIDTEGKVVLFMGVDKAKFRRPVVPGDKLELHVHTETRRPPVWKYKGVAKVDGAVVAEAEFKAMLTEPK